MESRQGTDEDRKNYISVNKNFWDERAPAHAASTTYDFAAYKTSATHLSAVVTFDLPRLPPLQNLNVIHLQCHIGSDTLSLARLGAASVLGLDFSSASVTEARALAAATHGSGGEKLRYIESDVYNAVSAIKASDSHTKAGGFDFVFTGVGALCWLPSIKQWAQVIAALLKPGGRFFIRECHPVMWSLDDAVSDTIPADVLSIKYPYFERERPTIFEDAGTYAKGEKSTFETAVTVEFHHGIGEIIEALLAAGMRITGFSEHDSVPWEALPGRMERMGGDEWRLKDRPWRVPHSYTLQAVKE